MGAPTYFLFRNGGPAIFPLITLITVSGIRTESKTRSFPTQAHAWLGFLFCGGKYTT
jgi:hypothetical protein